MGNPEDGVMVPRAEDFFCGSVPKEITSTSPVIPERERSKEPLYKTLSVPISTQIEVTQSCNLLCRHCYNYWRGESSSTPSTLDREHLFQTLEELDRYKIFRVTFTGGEPLLHKDLVIEAIRWATARKIDCAVNSNLTTVSEEDAFALKESGVQAILVSLISFDEETHDRITQRRGSFKKTVKGIRNVLTARIPLMVHTVVSQANRDQVYETGRFVANLGVKAFAATKVSPTLGVPHFSEYGLSKEMTKQSLEALLKLREDFALQTDILECYPLCLIGDAQRFTQFVKRSCSAGTTTMVIGANGDIRPCIHSNEVSGNIFKEGLKEAWMRMNRWRDGSLIPQVCHECEYLRECSAGCRVEAQYFGDISGMDPYASSPQDVIVPSSIKSFEFLVDERFFERRLKINPNLRMREENFGGIVTGGSSYIFLNEDSYTLIKSLKDSPSLVAELSQNYNVDREQALTFFTHLLKS